jgi:ABC-type spermidine/putrescine transport system permease subunit I
VQAQAVGGELVSPPAARSGRVGRLARLWPFTPIALVLLLLFFLPLANMVVYSFWKTVNFRIEEVWNLDNYARFFANQTYLRTFGKTILMAALVTAAGLATAGPFAYFLVRYVGRRWQRIILVATIVPFWTSYLLRVYSWQIILGERGALNQALMALGILHEPSPVFVYNNLGVFLVLLYVYFPFAALAIYASLEKFDFDQLRAAQDLGARPDQAILRILIPQIRPGLITAAIFVFIPILGEYLTPNLVGGTEGVLISNLIVNFFRAAQIPAGTAPALLIALFVTVLLIVFRRYLRIDDVVTRV